VFWGLGVNFFVFWVWVRNWLVGWCFGFFVSFFFFFSVFLGEEGGVQDKFLCAALAVLELYL
jgi:flagellar biosynthesis protein FliR